MKEFSFRNIQLISLILRKKKYNNNKDIIKIICNRNKRRDHFDQFQQRNLNLYFSNYHFLYQDIIRIFGQKSNAISYFISDKF
jgi:CII-binding regulator of phage lambda lysogenization HflD